MAPVYERSLTINAPPEHVYDYLLDIAAHKEWGEMDELELLYEGPLQVGSRWRSSGTTSGFEMHDECTITTLMRPNLFAFRVRSQAKMGIGEILLSYRLEPVPEGTRVTFSRETLSTEMSGVMKVMLAIPGMQRLMDAMVTTKAVDRGLTHLRDRLEKAHA